ncbi:MAG: ABC transporter ATP-binding protein [Thermoprotei archaeon]|nr:MAG: ABC transporter ATP-binding protein [Thermoprotei archaeon]
MGAVVQFEDVWKSFGSSAVIQGVSFTVNSGEIVVLLGPNGSGKSTLFKMTLGIIKPDRGQVLVEGVDAVANPIEARRRVGYMPEELIVYESLKINEYLEFMSSVYGVQADVLMVEKIIDLLGLREYAGKFIGELSHGTKRKVILASLMLREPHVLVLDEVFSGLDPSSARIVKTWVRELVKRGAGALISTHVLPIAEAVADRVLIIHRGRIVSEGKPSELKELFGAKELEEVFLQVTGYSPETEKVVRALYE